MYFSDESLVCRKLRYMNINIHFHEPFVCATDFQQIELRLLAHLANDSTLLQLFNRHCEKDIFKELTAQWFVQVSKNYHYY